MDKETLAAIALELEVAELGHRAVSRLTKQYPDLSLANAYAIQNMILKRKIEHGCEFIGYKIGFTSKAKMVQMNVHNPIYGFLMDYFTVPNTNALYLDELIHPRVEAEIAFRIAESIKGPGVTETQVMAAVDGIMPAIEVVDSRFENFDFDLPSVVADNASSSRFVTGDKLDEFERLDLSTLGVVLEINGEIVDTGAGAAVLGHPARSVALLANMLADSGQHIPAGSIVLTGGITAAHAIGRGDQVMARVHELGTVSFQVK